MHVHTCRRQEIAHKLERMQSELIYCYDCFDWFVEEEWDEHCLTHLKSLSSKRCASITYCSVLLRPSFCPFCMGDERLRPSSQWQSWTKEAKLWSHLTAHVMACCWPLKCPHPLCSLQFDDDVSFLYHLDDVHSLQMSPQIRKSWPNRRDSKSLICWIPDTTHQKRERPDKSEEEILRAKRHARQAQIGTREVPTRGGSLNQEDSDATQMPPRITPSEVSLVDTAFDDDAMPELTYSDSTSSSEIDNFQSIDDFSTDESSSQTELPDLFELSNNTSIIQPSRNEAPLLNEETVFSQYLRSPSPECFNTQVISHNVEDHVNIPPQRVSPTKACLLPEDHQFTEPISCHRVNSQGDPKISTKPRITLRLHPPKSSPKPKLTLKLSQPKGNPARVSAFRNMKSRQRRRR